MSNAEKPTISFFCPAYYDEKNVPRVVEKALETFSRIAGEFEIVIVEDGSPDGTKEAADRLAAIHPEVRVVHHPENRGYGEAIKTGFREANRHEWLCFCDGDDQYDVREAEKMLGAVLASGRSGCIAYRTVNANGLLRRTVSRIYAAYIRRAFKTPYRDYSCALRLIRREAIDKIDIKGRSPFVSAEIVLRLHFAGCRLDEVGIVGRPRLHGRASIMRPKNILHTIREMLALKRELVDGLSDNPA